MFNNYGVIHIDKNKISEDEVFEMVINAGAKECNQLNEVHEIITEKEDFYKIKTLLEKKIDVFSYSAIEWRALNYLNLDKEQSKKMLDVINNLDELDDVQEIYTNANLNN